MTREHSNSDETLPKEKRSRCPHCLLAWDGTPHDCRELLFAEVQRLRRELIDTEREMRAEMRDVAAEASWKARQGEDDYGSW